MENLVGNSADGEAYHGYWAQNIYEVNTNFGSASDLLALSEALHNAGMYLMVDIVTNHMGYLGCGTCVQYNTFNPFNSVSHLPAKKDFTNLLAILLPSILPDQLQLQ